jgi:LysR family transcriptional regulator, glycine cleavage system transcriptional activator
VDVRISATERLVDFGSEPVDIGIRYGLGGYPGLVSTKLADDALIVVAAPSIASRHDCWRVPHLARETLLCDDFPDAWGRWFRARARNLSGSVRRNQLTDSSMLVEAAVRGQGVALARWSLALDELRLGTLVLLFPKLPPLPTGLAYYMVSPREKLRHGAVSAFRSWVQAEAQILEHLR